MDSLRGEKTVSNTDHEMTTVPGKGNSLLLKAKKILSISPVAE